MKNSILIIGAAGYRYNYKRSVPPVEFFTALAERGIRIEVTENPVAQAFLPAFYPQITQIEQIFF